VAVIPLDDDPRERRFVWERIAGYVVVAVCCIWIANRVHLIDYVAWRTPGPDWLPDIAPRRISSLVLRNTTTNGGDMGAHVYWPKFLADNWFGDFRLQGWSPDWYSGFPIGQFYFPLPALAIALLDLVVPYNIAFKLVVAAGPIMLPAACYYFASKLRVPWPAPPLFAVVAVRYLFEVRYGLNGLAADTGWTIYGGNLASTMAGEFSFTIGLALALFFVGALAQYLDNGRRGWLPAALLAGTVLSHIVVAAFAAVLAVLVALVHWWRVAVPQGWGVGSGFRRVTRMSVPVAAVAALLTATWSLPLVAAQRYTASMRYEKQFNWGSFLFGLDSANPDGQWVATGDMPRPYWLWALVAVAVFAAAWWRRASTLIIAVAATVFALLFVHWPEHHIWNTRFAPFYWLLLGFLAATGAAELCRIAGYCWNGVADWVREGDRLDHLAALVDEREASLALAGAGGATLPADDALERGIDIDGPTAAAPAPPIDSTHDSATHGAPPKAWTAAGLSSTEAQHRAAAELVTELPARLQPDSGWVRRRRRLSMVLVMGVLALAIATWSFVWTTDHQGVGSGWSRWNFQGYEVKRIENDGKGWLEYKALMDAMGALEPGRALWETGHDEFDNYGGSLALELLPYWTDGRIGSMEGLYFESSATMPYHFLTVSRVANSPSNPVRGLAYGSTADFEDGVAQMRMLGVRYYMAWTDAMIDRADESPDLRLVDEVGDIDGAEPNRWRIYEIEDWALVAPLDNEPVVATVHGGDKAECFGTEPREAPYYDPELAPWECAAGPWWMNSSLLPQTFAADGPDEWRRIDIADLADVEPRPLGSVQVSDVVEDVDAISFEVDRVGVPVVVRSSYFPNWEVSGAEGPWRISPNLMVVVPTEREVRLSYGLTSWDWVGRIGTLLGIAGIVWLARRRVHRSDWFRALPPPRDPVAATDAVVVPAGSLGTAPSETPVVSGNGAAGVGAAGTRPGEAWWPPSHPPAPAPPPPVAYTPPTSSPDAPTDEPR
jgi:hypothetical protein